jgi:hypothetical protein
VSAINYQSRAVGTISAAVAQTDKEVMANYIALAQVYALLELAEAIRESR